MQPLQDGEVSTLGSQVAQLRPAGSLRSAHPLQLTELAVVRRSIRSPAALFCRQLAPYLPQAPVGHILQTPSLCTGTMLGPHAPGAAEARDCHALHTRGQFTENLLHSVCLHGLLRLGACVGKRNALVMVR